MESKCYSQIYKESAPGGPVFIYINDHADDANQDTVAKIEHSQAGAFTCSQIFGSPSHHLVEPLAVHLLPG